jgi:hypothetical protein
MMAAQSTNDKTKKKELLPKAQSQKTEDKRDQKIHTDFEPTKP